MSIITRRWVIAGSAMAAIGVLLFALGRVYESLGLGDSLANEKPRARHHRLLKEAGEALHKICSNEVIGLRLIVQHSVSDEGEDPKQWTGKALVEYFNRQGGVERREVHFKFATRADDFGNPHVVCELDDHIRKDAAQRARDLAHQIEMNNIRLKSDMDLLETFLRMDTKERTDYVRKPDDKTLATPLLEKTKTLLVNHSVSNKALWAEFEKSKKTAGDLFDAEIPTAYDPLKSGLR